MGVDSKSHSIPVNEYCNIYSRLKPALGRHQGITGIGISTGSTKELLLRRWYSLRFIIIKCSLIFGKIST